MGLLSIPVSAGNPARPVNRPVFLTGFMATGKTKVGRLLARRMGRRFIDTDDMVEERAGMTIAGIFSEKGEAWFRDLEHACVVEVASRGDVVVALGGGAITQERNRDAIRESPGLLVCLQADLDTILERVNRKETRPLLAGLNREQKREKIERMLEERTPFYASANLAVKSCGERSPEETAEEIHRILEQMPPCPR